MIDFEIDRDELYRYLGYHEGRHTMTADMQKLIDRCVTVATRAMTPRMVFSPLLDIVREGESIHIDGMPLLGTDIRAHLEHSDRLVLMAVTLGSQIDALLRRTETLDMTSAVIMDAVANVAIEQVADICEADIRAKIEKMGLYMTNRYSPGYGDMPLASQRDLVRILDAGRRAGITLTENNLMIPRKSITAILGVSDIPVTGKRAGCNHCVMRDNCVYRKRGTTCDK